MLPSGVSKGIPRVGSIAILDRLLADYAVLSTQALSIHWNFQGPEFLSCHEFFEKRYQRLIYRMDEVAERLRALGALAPAGFSEWAELSDLEDIPLNFFERPEEFEKKGSRWESPLSLYLSKEQQVRDSILRTGIPRAEEVDDAVTEDLLVSCLKEHEKTIWMLRSLLIQMPSQRLLFESQGRAA